MLSSLALSLILTQWTTQGIRVIDEGITKGYATQVNCVGPLTCDSNGTIWTLTVTGGGGGAPTDATYVTMSANASLTNEVVVPTCTGTDKLTSNGTAISCATDQTVATSPGGSNTYVQFNDGGAFGGDDAFTWNKTTNMLSLGTGATSAGLTLADGSSPGISIPAGVKVDWGSSRTLTGANDVTYGSALTTPATFKTTAVTGGFVGPGITLERGSGGTALQMNTGARLHLGTGTNDYLVSDGSNISTPGSLTATGGFVGNASTATALAADPTNCSAGQAPLGVDASGNVQGCFTPGGGSPGHAITDEGGAALATQPTLNFVGAAVTATNDGANSRTNVTIPWPSLTNVTNPTGDWAATFPTGTKTLWTFTGSTDEAFTIHGDGAFTGTGDLVHINKTGTGAAAGSDALHVEVTSDTNMTAIRATVPTASDDGFITNGVATAASFVGPLTGNASTATQLAADPADCTAGQAPLGITASGAVTGCFTPPGTYTLPAASTTLGGVKMAAACAAGNHVSSIGAGGELTCSADAGGGSGSPGGSTTQVQYNNAGSFGGMARVTTDGNDLVLTGQTTHPAAPAAGSLKVAAFQHNSSSGPPIPQFVDGTLGFDHSIQPFTRSDDAHWGCVLPAAWGSATMTPTGSAQAGSATGTAGTVAWASTNEYTRAKWVNFPQASSAVNLNAGLRSNVDYVWRGNAAGIGGFYWWGSFAINTTDNTSRLFVGLKDATAVLTATADPTAALDTVFFGCNNAQTTMRICSNDNSGAATCTDLGANYPCTTTDTAYDVALWAAPNGGSIGYWIRRFPTAFETSGTISTDLPRNTVQLGWDFTRNTGGTADAIAAMRFGGTCWMSNP